MTCTVFWGFSFPPCSYIFFIPFRVHLLVIVVWILGYILMFTNWIHLTPAPLTNKGEHQVCNSVVAGVNPRVRQHVSMTTDLGLSLMVILSHISDSEIMLDWISSLSFTWKLEISMQFISFCLLIWKRLELNYILNYVYFQDFIKWRRMDRLPYSQHTNQYVQTVITMLYNNQHWFTFLSAFNKFWLHSLYFVH